jgi:hypothetical protein
VKNETKSPKETAAIFGAMVKALVNPKPKSKAKKKLTIKKRVE